MVSSSESSDGEHSNDLSTAAGRFVRKPQTPSSSSSDSEQEPADAEYDSVAERNTIREELKEMSFEEIMKLKEELGAKVYKEALFGADMKKDKRSKTDFKRANKNRPREMSSKRRVPLLSAEPLKKDQTVRDPRFDEKCGEYNSKEFKTNYEFVADIREKEISELKAKLKKTTDEDERQNIKFLLKRLQNQNLEEKKRKIKEEAMKEEQQVIQKAREEGHQPHFKTKRERKAQELVKQYLELKKSGKLNRYLERRRKKNAAKDRKRIGFS